MYHHQSPFAPVVQCEPSGPIGAQERCETSTNQWLTPTISISQWVSGPVTRLITVQILIIITRRSPAEIIILSVIQCRFIMLYPSLTTTRFKELRRPEDKIKNARIIYTSQNFKSRIIVFLSALPSFYTNFFWELLKRRYIISNWWKSPTQATQVQVILTVLGQSFYRAYSKPKPYRSFFEHKQSHTRLFFHCVNMTQKKLIPPIANSPYLLYFFLASYHFTI